MPVLTHDDGILEVAYLSPEIPGEECPDLDLDWGSSDRGGEPGVEGDRRSCSSPRDGKLLVEFAVCFDDGRYDSQNQDRRFDKAGEVLPGEWAA